MPTKNEVYKSSCSYCNLLSTYKLLDKSKSFALDYGSRSGPILGSLLKNVNQKIRLFLFYF